MSSKNYRSISRRDFLKLAAATTAVLTVDCTRLEVLASKMGPKKELPVVVIGGGLGGLSAAAIFARNGFPVTLIEQHDRPGGYATSFDWAAGKFTFDVSLHATGDVSGGPMRPVFEKAGILHKIEMVDLPELCRIITPDLTSSGPSVTQRLSSISSAKHSPASPRALRVSLAKYSASWMKG